MIFSISISENLNEKFNYHSYDDDDDYENFHLNIDAVEILFFMDNEFIWISLLDHHHHQSLHQSSCIIFFLSRCVSVKKKQFFSDLLINCIRNGIGVIGVINERKFPSDPS